MLEIAKASIADLEAAPNIFELLDEYAAESAIAGMPPPAVNSESYKLMERTGALHTFTARVDGELIGYITILLTILPHYSVKIGISESWFVTKSQRKTGAGMKLLKAAEEFAEAGGAPGVLVSVPVSGALPEIMPSAGYAPVNMIFFKRLGVTA